MGLKIITPPTTEPVSLEEAKLHLRVDGTAEDTLITSLIKRAREEAEHVLSRTLAPCTLALFLDEFPDGAILLPRNPVTAIDHVKYVDADGVLLTLSSSAYQLDDAQLSHWILLAYGASWPSTRAQANAVQIQYRAGFAACPESVRGWMMLRIGSLYTFREDTITGTIATKLQFVDRMLDAQWVPPL